VLTSQRLDGITGKGTDDFLDRRIP
jgi:hypothetical protein